MFEAAGIAIFALTGAIVAARKGMDPFGFVLLATITGVGGGTLRLSGRGFGNINFGIAAMHIECALNTQPHFWRFSSDNKGLLITYKEET